MVSVLFSHPIAIKEETFFSKQATKMTLSRTKCTDLMITIWSASVGISEHIYRSNFPKSLYSSATRELLENSLE